MTSTLSRSISSCALFLVPAGLPPVSAEMNSTLRPGHLVVVLFQPGDYTLFHLDAALRQPAGLDGEQAELERCALRDRRCRKFEGCCCGADGCRSHELAATNFNGHRYPPSVAPVGVMGRMRFASGPYRSAITASFGGASRFSFRTSRFTAISLKVHIIVHCKPRCKAHYGEIVRRQRGGLPLFGTVGRAGCTVLNFVVRCECNHVWHAGTANHDEQ